MHSQIASYVKTVETMAIERGELDMGIVQDALILASEPEANYYDVIAALDDAYRFLSQ